MNRTFTNLLKFICCILIFIHHFYLSNPLVSSFGYIACSIFFLLSAYGISKSLEKHPAGLVGFAKKRLLKIYKPLLVVNIIFIAFTGLLIKGEFSIPVFGVFCNHIDIIKDYNLGKITSYVFGFEKIDSVTWFLDVLLVSYLVIWIVHQLKTTKHRNMVSVGAYLFYMIGCVVFPPPHILYE